ncbi:MAG: hypothetical protein WCK55_11355 [Verrucomicrobiota bacterium]
MGAQVARTFHAAGAGVSVRFAGCARSPAGISAMWTLSRSTRSSQCSRLAVCAN